MTSGSAVRTARRIAFDPRLAIGLALVLASIAGVVAIVSGTDRTVQILAADGALAPGDRIDADDLRAQAVRLDGLDGLYLAPGDIPVGGVVVTRPVAAGELVPASAVGSPQGLRLAAVVLDVQGALAASVQPASSVDIWAARPLGGGAFGPPVAIVTGAGVVRLVESDSIVSGGTVAVEVLVPRTKLARVLEAIANRDAVSIVPAGLPGR